MDAGTVLKNKRGQSEAIAEQGTFGWNDNAELNEYGEPVIEVLSDGTIIDRRNWTDLQKRLSFEGWKFFSDIAQAKGWKSFRQIPRQ